MLDIEEQLVQQNKAISKNQKAIDDFVNGADQGEFQSVERVVNKYKATTIPFTLKQYKFFELVKTEISNRTGQDNFSVTSFLRFLWIYHSGNKCNVKDYMDFYLFLSAKASKTKNDYRSVQTNWNAGILPLKDYVNTIDKSLGNIKVKGVILLLALHYARNELDIDLSEYKN